MSCSLLEWEQEKMGTQEGDGSVENAVPALSSPAEPCERVDDEVMRVYSSFGTKGNGGSTWALI